MPLYYAAGLPPWESRPYPFFNLFTIEARDRWLERIRREGPEYVLLRLEPPPEYYADTWQFFRDALTPLYTSEFEEGGFTFFRRQAP